MKKWGKFHCQLWGNEKADLEKKGKGLVMMERKEIRG